MTRTDPCPTCDAQQFSTAARFCTKCGQAILRPGSFRDPRVSDASRPGHVRGFLRTLVSGGWLRRGGCPHVTNWPANANQVRLEKSKRDAARFHLPCISRRERPLLRSGRSSYVSRKCYLQSTKHGEGIHVLDSKGYAYIGNRDLPFDRGVRHFVRHDDEPTEGGTLPIGA